MKIFKLFAIFFVTLCFDVVVYYDKIFKIHNTYMNNFVKVYFGSYVVFTLLYIVLVFGFSVFEERGMQQDKDKQRTFVDDMRIARKWYIRLLSILGFMIDVGYGIIGCWWFFAVGLIKQIFSYSFSEKLQTLAKKLEEEQPELKVSEKLDKRLKFKFVKKA